MITAHDKMTFMKDLNAQFPVGDDEYKVIYLDLLKDGYMNEYWRLFVEKNSDEDEMEFCRQWTLYLIELIDQEKRGASGPAPHGDEMVGGVI